MTTAHKGEENVACEICHKVGHYILVILGADLLYFVHIHCSFYRNTIVISSRVALGVVLLDL